MTKRTRAAPRVYTIEEAAELLRISRNSAYTAAKNGDLPTVRIGNLLRVPKAVIDRMLGDPDTAA
jgi:excisionase family DNA binding protein